jgi:hypothetical protein
MKNNEKLQHNGCKYLLMRIAGIYPAEIRGSWAEELRECKCIEIFTNRVHL